VDGGKLVQIDFDARRSQRRFYVRLLRDLRRRMPPSLPLSITALASWCAYDDWLSGLPIELRPDNNIADMKRLVEKFVKHDAGLAHSQLIARRRLGHVLAYGKANGAQ